MKNYSDPGLSYIKQLGLQKQNSLDNTGREIARLCGKEFADQYFESIFATRYEDPQSFYTHKNCSYEAAMIFTGAYDADIIRRVCNWIYNHQSYFGQTILEIGCDCGFITGYLSQLFPDSHIVSIDRNSNSIEIARRNVEKVGTGNVTFLAIDLNELEHEAFDTVFSMRTVQENREDADIRHIYDDWHISSKEFMSVSESYGKVMTSFVRDGGYIVSIERLNADPFLLSWIQQLCQNHISIKPESLEQIEAREMGNNSCFSMIIGQKESNPSNDNDELQEKWMALTGYQPNRDIWRGWASIVAVQQRAGQLVEGGYVLNKNNVVGKFACYKDKESDDHIIYQICAEEDNMVAQIYPANRLPEVLKNISGQLDHNQRMGFTIERMQINSTV